MLPVSVRLCIRESEMPELGRKLARALQPGCVIYLQGDLGSGKTTLARAVIQAVLPGCRVRSPTYTLLERYSAPAWELWHLDLYRLGGAHDLEPLDLPHAAAETVFLVEWPERAMDALPRADCACTLSHAENARNLHLQAYTARGLQLLQSVLEES